MCIDLLPNIETVYIYSEKTLPDCYSDMISLKHYLTSFS